jgi:hypothetical protein
LGKVKPRRRFGFMVILSGMGGRNLSRSALTLMVAQASLFNSVFFTYGPVLATFHHINPARIGLYILPLAAGNLGWPACAPVVRHRDAAPVRGSPTRCPVPVTSASAARRSRRTKSWPVCATAMTFPRRRVLRLTQVKVKIVRRIYICTGERRGEADQPCDSTLATSGAHPMEYFPVYGFQPVSVVVSTLRFVFRAWHRYLDVVLGEVPPATR